MTKLNNAHVNQAWNEMFSGQFQDSQQHTSPNTAAGVLLMHVLFHSVKYYNIIIHIIVYTVIMHKQKSCMV